MHKNEQPLAYELAYLIKLQRAKKGIGQVEAANRCEVSLQCFRNIEARYYTNRPSFITLKRIEIGLGFNDNQLVKIAYAELFTMQYRLKEEE